MSPLEHQSVRQLVERTVTKLGLNLTGLTVLTEAGSGWFLFTPLICLIAGCTKVSVWIADSPYGCARSISAQLLETCRDWDLNPDCLSISINERPLSQIESADIVTNLGHVRPLDEAFLKALKPNAFISTMCEAWELRPGDIDLDYCRANEISVDGVWENHPELRIFDFVGPLAAKLCFESGAEIFQSRVLVVSDDAFGEVVTRYLQSMGADQVDQLSPERVELETVYDYDFCVLCDYLSHGGPFSKERLQADAGQRQHADASLPGCQGVFPQSESSLGSLVHLAGSVDYQGCQKLGIKVYPPQDGYSFKMTKTLAYLGPRPVFLLHGAGLKVGENRFRGVESPLNQKIV